jgi:hypothetical protein
MDQSLLMQHGQDLGQPFLTCPLRLAMTGPDGFDEAFSGLDSVEKIVPNEIFCGHEIEPGASVVVKK